VSSDTGGLMASVSSPRHGVNPHERRVAQGDLRRAGNRMFQLLVADCERAAQADVTTRRRFSIASHVAELAEPELGEFLQGFENAVREYIEGSS